MPQHYSRDNYRNRQPQGRGNNPSVPSIDTHQIVFLTAKDKKKDKYDNPKLFSEIAERVAQTIALNRNSNKSTQLRKFYDEIVMWDQKLRMHPKKFNEYLPFIRMLNAKVAYAKGRNNLVDDNFMRLMSHCLDQVNDTDSMHTFKTFMEAFMGFYKVERPKD